jgi:alpha-mannosidase
VVENGPTRLVLAFKLRYGASTIEQQVVCYAHTPRVDFVNRVDWRSRHTLMKVAFPVQIHSSRATFDIGYGAIERATHWNTSWDWARFEVCGHKWADLSEADYGVSILNDCKYGWDVKDNVIRLSLLRSPTAPDPEADQGAHEFTYSFFPHEGDWKCGSVPESFDLNVPLLAAIETAHTGPFGSSRSFISVDRPNVIIDCVKKAEDSDELIVRCYEANGGRGPVTLWVEGGIESANETNILEETDRPLQSNGREVRFDVAPFELKTFKVKLKRV